MTTSAALLREHIQTVLGNRCEAAFARDKPSQETLPSPAGPVPRGALSEITGPVSSGRTSLLCSLLAEATSRQEYCALIDADDRFDPASAQQAGVKLSQVLWVQCRGNAEHALKSADLLVHGGGFGLVAIDLGDLPMRTVHRIPLSAWFRLRQAVEKTNTAVIVIARKAHTQSCAAVRIELENGRAEWRGLLFNGMNGSARYIRNHQANPSTFVLRP